MLKQQAGIEACMYVKNGMKVGLGTGSTVKHTVIELGRRIHDEGLETVSYTHLTLPTILPV